MINIDISLFIQMANFLVLLVLLNIVLYRPLRAMLKQREEKMGGLAADAEAGQLKADEAARDLADGKLAVHAEGTGLKNELKEEAYGREKALLAKIHEEMEVEGEQASARIAEQIGQARESLKDQVEGFSLQAAQQILGRSF